jgi:hypothetical protein
LEDATQYTGPNAESDVTGRMVVPRLVENICWTQKDVLPVIDPTVEFTPKRSG